MTTPLFRNPAPVKVPDAQTSVRSDQAAHIAADIWGGTRCEARPPIVVAPIGRAYLAESQWSERDNGTYYDCKILYSRAYTKVEFAYYCAIIVHEYGHLDGKEHSSNPYSVMHATLTRKGIPRKCGRPSTPVPASIVVPGQSGVPLLQLRID